MGEQHEETSYWGGSKFDSKSELHAQLQGKCVMVVVSS